MKQDTYGMIYEVEEMLKYIDEMIDNNIEEIEKDLDN
jgi:predicted DNA-binding transcriptional regulator